MSAAARVVARAGAGSGRRWRRLGAIVAVSALVVVASGCGLSLQKLPKPGVAVGNTYPLSARFSDVLNLPIGAQVRIGPRIVGSVTSLSVHHYRATVGLRIKNGVHLPHGTTVQVRFDNPLGDQYLELHPPKHGAAAASFVKPGSTLPLASTEAAPTIAATLGAFAIVLNGGGIGDIETILDELNKAFDGNEPQIRSLMHNLDVAAKDLAGGMGSIDASLNAMAELAKRLNAGADVLPKALQALTKSLGILAGQKSQITALLNGLKSFGAVGNQVIAQSGRQTVQAIQKLVPVVQQVTRANAEIAPALGNLAALEAQVPTIAKGGYAEVSATVPIVVSSEPSAPASGAAARVQAQSMMTAVGAIFANPSARGTAVGDVLAAVGSGGGEGR